MSALTIKSTALLTAEEFYLLPAPVDGSQQELVKGVVVTMPPPSNYHGRCCSLIDRRLGVHVETHNLGIVTANDSGVLVARGPDTVRGPDIAFWSRDRLPNPPRHGYPDVAPDLAAEVLSPSDVFSQVLRKAQEYFSAGVRLVWIFVPDDQSISIHRPGQPPVLLGITDTLTGDDVVPGFSCPVAQFFP